MTIRIRNSYNKSLDPEQIAALVTRSLLQPTNDDAPEALKQEPGSNWLRWGDCQSKRLQAGN